jgi:hypothetical protein
MEIKTEKSFLEVKNYNNENLIKECIKDIEDKLLIKPEIKIMGKICYQKRDINFFSNDIDEYKYSNKNKL